MENIGLEEYVAAYVKDFVRINQEDSRLLESLKKGDPLISSEWLCVSELGKVSSEIVTDSVGKYLNQIISVIYSHHGDIVKFLGISADQCV
ncbi:hypothetical protein HDU97_008105 [Phlyctochytrium planicorne]|nr:hypothetical protein HDU97_008105 [Phlyctochytrium planicorne]